ncbi:hypothetical protein BWI17_09520 [Betaproteobacteria bacterium GR16-43]|nr:hypothetical protein BWI17_09520 [Betaproteobacteria bacterium GR16-43]
MREAAQGVIASVDAEKRSKLVLPFEDAKRTDWHYTPRSRPGLSFADLDTRGREAVHKLLRTALSEAGHRRVVNIIELELVLRESPFGLSLIRDPEKYSIVFFGAPDATKTWGWRFEGHHLSLNFTLRGDRVAATPSFFGANPAEVRTGPRKGLRALAPEEDEARKFFALLDEAQRRAVVIDTRSYGDIVTTNQDLVSPIDNRGLEARALTPPQRAQLRKLVEVYADSFEPGLRAARLARVDEGGMESVRFAWAGATTRGAGPHYYRIQGPKFLIEYDASQDDGNHVHTVWRDFTGDFGRDLLRDHYSASHR